MQSGLTTYVLTHPETAFAATLAGTNLVVGAYRDPDTVVAADGLPVVGTAVESLRPAARAAGAFSPRAVAVYPSQPHGSPRNTWPAVVGEVVPQGDRALIRCRCGDHDVAAEVTWASVAELGLGAGVAVHLSVKATEVRIYGAAESRE
ncbi:TOBE domain-containing protein [Gordonia sp. DT30]|uniref:TOBE domain-containing protein n=1 Tax=unclassified Gordonia (in: high G+C Gram-positive bacteria) TaxID=2657482 RepID=UPI003CEA1EF7